MSSTIPSDIPIPCTACGCSGSYVGYGGPGIHLQLKCTKCDGRGWIGLVPIQVIPYYAFKTQRTFIVNNGQLQEITGRLI